MGITKRVLPWFLIPLSLVMGASLVKLNQLRAPTGGGPTLLVSLPNGTVVQGKVAGMTVDGNNNVILPTSSAVIPSITVTHVSTSTLNNFPIPVGKTICYVSNNIPMALMEDYTIINNAIVFNTPPVVDDIVQLLCF